jgi:hypothetical protein
MARPTRPTRSLARSVLCTWLLGAALVAGGCGKKAAPPRADAPCVFPTSPAAPDLSTPGAALESACRAAAAGDFEALAACSTSEGVERIRRDLLAWNALLSDGTAGPRALARIPSPRDDAEKARYRAGFTGDPSGLLSMLARSQGTVVGARVEVPVPAAGVERVETDRAMPDGTRRRVVLVLRDGAWRVDRFAL